MSGLYLHIPFCKKKCGYCDFYSFCPADGQMDAYRDALCRSVIGWADAVATPFDTVYFGGGTPSFFGGERIAAVLGTVRQVLPVAPDAEITVECNPGSVTAALTDTLAAAGVNRVSLGVQSALDSERSWLGRASDRTQVENAVRAVRSSGIGNLSLDLMLGIPAQTEASLDESLRFLIAQGVPHVSAYLLKLEDGTPLHAQRDRLPLPDEDTVCALYLQAAEALEAAGLKQYEISNFARPGFESRHNLHYWRDEEYLGLGPAAHSFFGGKRFYYPRDFGAFLRGDAPVPDGDGGGKEEFCMLRLRLTEGLSDRDFFARFGEHLPQAMFDRAKQLEPHGLLTVRGDAIALTKQGFLLSNRVIGALVEALCG